MQEDIGLLEHVPQVALGNLGLFIVFLLHNIHLLLELLPFELLLLLELPSLSE
jgi:hypothetical protein